MNFFKSKEPDISEISREKRVKEFIISELSACLKTIQSTQQTRKSGEPIYTSDSSNYLCTILEAALLHGHKSTHGILRQTTDLKAFDRCSFWSFIQRFTHRDTINQLKRLTHIKTETGVCRAWVKLAINDGLMESYLVTILSQPQVLRQYYNKTALLRDLEQPDILLKLIKVLVAANYDFQLVYNSSQLNVWSMKTLALAGLVERQFVFDRGFSASNNPSPQRSRSSTLDMDDLPFEFSAPRYKPVVDAGVMSSNHESDSLSEVFDEASENSMDVEDSVTISVDDALLSNSCKVTIHDFPQTVGRSIDPRQADDLQTLPNPKLPVDSGGGLSNGVSEDSQAEGCDLEGRGVEGSNGRVGLSTLGVREPESSNNSMGDAKDAQGQRYGEAERELARLRTAQYSIGDIINLTTPSQVPVASESHDTASSGDISTAQVSNHIPSQSDKSPAEGLSDEEEVYTSPALVEASPPLGTEAIQSEEPLSNRIKFELGTPQSPSHLFPGQQEGQPEDDEEQGETTRELYLHEEDMPASTDSPSTIVDESPYSRFPFSAAQAILSKRLSGPGSQAGSLPRATVAGSSLSSMSHGNSLASLTGWGPIDKIDTPQCGSVSLEQVPSFADLVSEIQQSDAQTLGSPQRDYSAVTAAAANNTAAVAAANNTAAAELKNTQETQLQEAESQVEKSPANSSFDQLESDASFEVIGEVHKDVLLNYGKLWNEEGLDTQGYKCDGCSAPIGIIYGAPRVCSYTMKYYCPQCHINEESYIPAKILYNWDFAKYKVCKSSKEFLISAEQIPLLNIQEFNNRLYSHVSSLEALRVLRTQLFYLKRYVFACSPSAADDLKQKFWPKEYVYEEIHTYTIQDLISINTSSTFAHSLKRGIKLARKHVEDCESCEYRGFLCEICKSTKVIFPFDLETTTTCERCNGVYHKLCLTSGCPKCERHRLRDSMLGNSALTDYSVPHI